MDKFVIIQKTCSLLTERGIEVGDKLKVRNEGPSDQRKDAQGKWLMTYCVNGKAGTPIVVYQDECTIVEE